MFRGDREVTLAMVLRALGASAVATSRWTISDAECAGQPAAADEVHRYALQAEAVSGVRLLALADEGVQLINGLLLGRAIGDKEPWVVIRAVRSSDWDIEAADEILNLAQGFFPEASPLPD